MKGMCIGDNEGVAWLQNPMCLREPTSCTMPENPLSSVWPVKGNRWTPKSDPCMREGMCRGNRW